MWVLPQTLRQLNLRKFYIVTIIGVSLMMILMHIIGVFILQVDHESARLIELAQRQKLLSQQLIKLALLTERRQADLDAELYQIAQLKNEWSQAHFSLKFGNDNFKIDPPSNKKIDELMIQIQPHKEAISDAVNELLMVAHVADLRADAIDKLCMHEKGFLPLMDEIKIAYQQNGEENILVLSYVKFFLLLITLLAMLLLFLLYTEIEFSGQYAYSNQLPDGQDYFSEKVAEEFLLFKASQADQSIFEGKIGADIPNQKNDSQQALHKPERHRARVLIIQHENIPIDYLAWFLNKHEIDFRIVQDKPLCIIEAQSEVYDMVLMSHLEAYSEKKLLSECTIPIVILEAADIDEIHALIYEEQPSETENTGVSMGNLYRKIERHIPKDKLSV